MPAYLIVNVEVKNPTRYQEYLRQVTPTVEAYGGRYVVRGGRTEVLEGNWVPRRIVVIEFSDAARARAWWDSAEYASAKKIRQECAKTEMIIAEGM